MNSQKASAFSTPGHVDSTPIIKKPSYMNNNNDNNDNQQTIFLSTNKFPFMAPVNKKCEMIPQTEKQNQQSQFTSLLGVTNYAMFICVLIEDDSPDSSDKLNITLNSIHSGVLRLAEFGFTCENVLICCFIRRIETNAFVMNEAVLFPHHNRILSCWRFLSRNPAEPENQLSGADSGNLTILLTTAQKHLTFTFPEAIAFMHNQIVPSLTSKKIVYITTVQNGVSTSDTTFPDLLCSLSKNIHESSAQNTRNPNIISVASVENVPLKDSQSNYSMWSRISQYELVHHSNYDLNFYDVSGGVPIDHRFNIMQLDLNGRNIIKNIYNKLPSNASIEHCDYAASIEAVQSNIEVQYCTSVEAYINNIKPISYADYMERFVTKHGSDYSCLTNIITNTLTCKPCNVLSKLIRVLQLIGMLFEMIQPSLTCMVAYSVFAEGFNTFSTTPAIVFTSLLGVMFALSGVVSLINKRPQTNYAIHFIFLIVYEIYYLFTIIVAICAVYFIKHKRPVLDESVDACVATELSTCEHYKDYVSILGYTFNTTAVVSIILINVILGIVPMVIEHRKFFGQNFVNGLLYLIMGSVSANSHFLVSYLHNIGEYRGNNVNDNNDHTKVVYVIVFYLANYFVGYLTLLNEHRQERLNAVLVLSIIFTCYNSLKCLAVALRELIVGRRISGTIKDKADVAKIKSAVDGEGPQQEEHTIMNSAEENKVTNECEVAGEEVKNASNGMKPSGHKAKKSYVNEIETPDGNEEYDVKFNKLNNNENLQPKSFDNNFGQTSQSEENKV